MDGTTPSVDIPFYSAFEKTRPGQIYLFNAQRVRPLPDQPRTKFLGIQALAENIREEGQKTPGLVEIVASPHNVEFDAQLIDGERRLRACRLVSLQFRAYVDVMGSEVERYKTALIANFHREPLTAMGVARSLQKIVELDMKNGVSKQDAVMALAKCCTKSPTWVIQHLNLTKLVPEVQELLDSAEETGINFQTAQFISRLDASQQGELVRQLVGKRPAEARRIALAAVRLNGGRTRKFRKNAFVNFIYDLEQRFGIYLDMKQGALKRLLQEIPLEERKRAIERISGLRDALRTFNECLK